MTADHVTAAQKAVSALIPGDFDNTGWGFGVAVVTRRELVSAPVGSYGWAGGLGTSWRSDPSEDMVAVLLTRASWISLIPARVSRDFGILAYQAIDD
jgi:CubicO group peptidase (beta-lactamase class C family)